MRSSATATPVPSRSWPRIADEGWSGGISLRRNTTAGVASRGIVSSASIRVSAPGLYGEAAAPEGEGLLRAVGDEAALEVVGRDADGDAVPRDHADTVLAHLAVEAGEHLVVLAALHLVVATGQHFGHDSLQFDQVFLAHPLSVSRATFDSDAPAPRCPPAPSRCPRIHAARRATTTVRNAMAKEKTIVPGPAARAAPGKNPPISATAGAKLSG